MAEMMSAQVIEIAGHGRDKRKDSARGENTHSNKEP